MSSNLKTVEKKVLGALLILSDENMVTEMSLQTIAEAMGYKSPGGALTFAIQALEMKNYIAITKPGRYKVLL